VRREGEAYLFKIVDISVEARFSEVQDAPEEDPWQDRLHVLRQSQLMQGEHAAGEGHGRKAVPDAEEERIDEGQGSSGLEGDDGVQGTPFRRVQEKVPQEKQLGINELILQGEVRGVPVQQKVERTEE
jgi:hypothetical protein